MKLLINKKHIFLAETKNSKADFFVNLYFFENQTLVFTY